MRSHFVSLCISLLKTALKCTISWLSFYILRWLFLWFEGCEMVIFQWQTLTYLVNNNPIPLCQNRVFFISVAICSTLFRYIYDTIQVYCSNNLYCPKLFIFLTTLLLLSCSLFKYFCTNPAKNGLFRIIKCDMKQIASF